MADHRNREFKQNPVSFLKSYDILVAPGGTPVRSQQLFSGPGNIDLVPIGGQVDRDKVRIEDYDHREHGMGASPIIGYYLPAKYNDSVTIQIGGDRNRKYMFTADLSGCLFAAYGDDGQSLTVEHVNDRHDGKARVDIVQRGQALIDQGYTFFKMVSPVPLSNFSNCPQDHVRSYDAQANVIGVADDNGNWTFYLKLGPDNVVTL